MSEDNILTPRGWMRGRLVHAHGKVTAIDGAPCDPADNDLPYLLPGFIDLHVHGGGGKDIMEGASAFETITRTHVRFGTTSLLATTMTAPVDETASVLGQLGTFCAQRPAGSARVLGVHLEGPYINPGKLGAQPNFAHTALMEEVEAYLRLAPIRVITIAPEIAGHDALIRRKAALVDGTIPRSSARLASSAGALWASTACCRAVRVSESSSARSCSRLTVNAPVAMDVLRSNTATNPAVSSTRQVATSPAWPGGAGAMSLSGRGALVAPERGRARAVAIWLIASIPSSW